MYEVLRSNLNEYGLDQSLGILVHETFLEDISGGTP